MPPMIEKLLAAIALVVCVVLMIRLLVGARRRYAMDHFGRRTALRVKFWWLSVYHWRSSRKTAARVAEEAIRRARGGNHNGSWDGNVYKPKSFKRPRKPH